jgi:hypothetical protein
MSGTSIVNGGVVGLNAGPTWQIEGTGGYFGNGQTGILFQNGGGEVAV